MKTNGSWEANRILVNDECIVYRPNSERQILYFRFRNGVEVISDTKHIKITDHPEGVSILLLDSADQARDALTYRAVAINEAGEAETSGILTVKPATRSGEPEERPMFLHGMRDVLTDEDLPLIIEVGFTGNPIPSVEWMKNNIPLTPTDRILMTCDGRKVSLSTKSSLLGLLDNIITSFISVNYSVLLCKSA